MVSCGSGQTAASGTFTTAYWYWSSYGDKPGVQGSPLDKLYVHAGAIQQEKWLERRGQWTTRGWLDTNLPSAQHYWLVFRCESPGIPPLDLAPGLAVEIANVLDTAGLRKLPVQGVQLDVDSPTASLPAYAQFVRAVRTALRERQNIETNFSVTALLDWFRKGTAIASLIEEVDEFVPQFYDVAAPGNREASVAHPFDAARWGGVFGAFGKPYRVGISTFGRMRTIAVGHSSAPYGLSLLDLGLRTAGADPEFRLETKRAPSGELQLNYVAQRPVSISYSEFRPGDIVQVVIPDVEVIQKAAQSARTLPPPFSGLVFFRWPSPHELLTLQPASVLAAANAQSPPPPASPQIETVDGGCAAVHCADLVLNGLAPLQPVPLNLRIRSSVELEYFLPEENMPVRVNGSSELDLALPPYGSRDGMRLGRAVTREPATFTLEPLP